MRKYADRYFGVDPWLITEEGFDPSYGEVSESIFSLGNEHMGVRGYFDETYSGASLIGCYINGVYERTILPKPHYKGIAHIQEGITDTVNWLHTDISVGDKVLDLATAKFSEFSRSLDMSNGELKRSFIWHVDKDTDIKFDFSRLLSMKRMEIGASRIRYTVLRGKADVSVKPRLVFLRDDIWIVGTRKKRADGYLSATATTKVSGMSVYAGMRIEKKPGELTRFAHVSKHSEVNAESLSSLLYDELLKENREWWDEKWSINDIVIGGNPEDQQGIRYCIFQMNQTVHSGKGQVVIGAKGLTGLAYGGNTFWETEVYCLPFYLFTNPEAANGILEFRYHTLEQAKKRAKELDCDGAFYPISTVSGLECCHLWQHSNTQLQATTAVAYALWLHAQVTGDDTYLKSKGIPILMEICRMLATRGDFDPVSGEYGYFGVMGPDEFQVMVNHNMYTNYLAKKTFEFTLKTLKELGTEETTEHADWRVKADKMRILYDPETLLFEQHDGYFRLPHLDISAIPPTEFPLYSYWSYDRIYRNDMIKQPDVLMYMFMYASDFTKEQLKANFDYYEPRCIHESSLSPSVHSIIAARLGIKDLAYNLFKIASRLDLDNYNRNTCEGLHTTSLAGSWMNIVYGFGGLQSDGEILSFDPVLPDCWQSLSFKLVYRGSVIRIDVTKDVTEIKLESGPVLKVKLNGETLKLSG